MPMGIMLSSHIHASFVAMSSYSVYGQVAPTWPPLKVLQMCWFKYFFERMKGMADSRQVDNV